MKRYYKAILFFFVVLLIVFLQWKSVEYYSTDSGKHIIQITSMFNNMKINESAADEIVIRVRNDYDKRFAFENRDLNNLLMEYQEFSLRSIFIRRDSYGKDTMNILVNLNKKSASLLSLFIANLERKDKSIVVYTKHMDDLFLIVLEDID